jgi:hypothetical protein
MGPGDKAQPRSIVFKKTILHETPENIFATRQKGQRSKYLLSTEIQAITARKPKTLTAVRNCDDDDEEIIDPALRRSMQYAASKSTGIYAQQELGTRNVGQSNDPVSAAPK